MLDQILQVLGVGEGRHTDRDGHADPSVAMVHVPPRPPATREVVIDTTAQVRRALPDPVPAIDLRQPDRALNQQLEGIVPDRFVDTSQTHATPTSHALNLSRYTPPSGGYKPPAKD